MQIKTKTPDVTGNFRNLNIIMSAPANMNFKDITVKELMVLVGTNGSGKTFALVSVYVLGFVLQTAVVMKDQPQDILKTLAQFAVTHCYSDLENTTGVISGETIYGSSISITIDKGVVTDVQIVIPKETIKPSNVVYMSSNLRLFSNISMYLKLRKANTGIRDTSEEIIAKMLKDYKLYDVMTMERLLAHMPMATTPEMLEHFEKFDLKEDITSFNVDLVQCEMYAVIGADKRKNLSSYGNGHQAMLNMIITQYTT